MNLNPDQKAEAIETLQNALKIIEALPASTPCHECDYFNPDDGYCDNHGERVPAGYQSAGCDQWVAGIPF